MEKAAESTATAAVAVEAAAARPARPSTVGLIQMMLLDVGLPLLAYYGLHTVGVGDYRALLAGTVVAGLRVTFVALHNRRFDGFATFLMAVFTVGLALSFATGDARFMLAKDSVGTAVAGLIFLGTCVVGRPMTFYAAQRFSATSEKQAWWNIKWQTSPGFRRGFRVMSMVWGVGLLIEAAMRIPLIYVLPIHVMVGLSTVLQAAVLTLLIAWTMWYGKRMRRRPGATASASRPRFASKCSRDDRAVAEFDTTAVHRRQSSPPVELGARKAVPDLRTRATPRPRIHFTPQGGAQRPRRWLRMATGTRRYVDLRWSERQGGR